MIAKVEAIKRAKNRCVGLLKVYKEDKEWDAQPNDDDAVNDVNSDMGFESENCGGP